MKKDVHIYLDYGLVNQIEAIAKIEHKKISTIYARLLNQGLSQIDVDDRLDIIDYGINKILSISKYSQKLLQDFYSKNYDIDIFNNEYRQRNSKLNE